MKKELATTIAEHPFPSSIEVEMQVIADLINSSETMTEARRIIRPEMFSDERCNNAWKALCEMDDKRQSIDLMTVSDKIGQSFTTHEILTQKVSTPLESIAHYNVLASLHVRKNAYQFALKMLQVASDGSSSLDELISLPESFVSKLRSNLNYDADTITAYQAINEVAEMIEKTIKDKKEGKATRVPTGFKSLDWITYGGFNAGNLVILAARPSVGKTAVMLQFARTAAEAGIPSTIFSLEMTNQEIGQRLLLSTGVVTPIQIASGNVDWNGFDNGAGKFVYMPLHLNDSARTIDEITRRIALLHQSGKCGIAFIDYLGLIDTQTEGRTPLYQVIASMTKRLKHMAKICHIPIVLLCQLNRSSASENRPPALYDLRDSGSIEQDADIVLMLERPAISEDSRLNMWVRKNRQGKAGDLFIELTPDSTYTNFKEESVRRV